ncbi:unnamed protein product [marine sediment metagenome]|uniref:Uncharacterized protein n=1 Tax=marine sediment metagenome TaxID=412755 RepID=X0TT74_9ZZZZ
MNNKNHHEEILKLEGELLTKAKCFQDFSASLEKEAGKKLDEINLLKRRTKLEHDKLMILLYEKYPEKLSPSDHVHFLEDDQGNLTVVKCHNQHPGDNMNLPGLLRDMFEGE